MASSDDFRKQLKAGNITEALALALSDAIELKITTWVASAGDDGEATKVKPGHRLQTCINMIDGHIENEIGDQFLGNGPYKELRQFHLDQVAQGNQIIQNNLKSLQKLFEVLVSMQHQAATTAVIEPDALGIENQLLPSTEEATESGLENFDSSVGVAGLTQQHWAIAPTELAGEESALYPNTVTQENIAQDPPSPPEEPVSFLTTPTDSIQELDSETDEDNWDDSVLDLLESLPVHRPSSPEEFDSEFDEDRRNLIADDPESEATESDWQANQDWGTLRREDFESLPTSPEPHIESLNAQFDEDWGDFIQEEPEPHPAAFDSSTTQDRETFTPEDLESLPTSPEPHIESLNAQFDEDWGDFIQEEPEPHPTGSDAPVTQDREILRREDFELLPEFPEPQIKVSSSEVQEDWGWGDLVVEEPESHPAADSAVNRDSGTLTPEELELPLASPEPHIEASISQVDEDWGDMLEQEPEHDSDKPVPNIDSLNLEEDEEWDEWVVEEPEHLQNEPAIAELDPFALEEDEDWGDLEDDTQSFVTAPTLPGSTSNLGIDEDWDDLAAELDEDTNISVDFNPSASLEDTNAAESAHHQRENPNLKEVLFGETESQKTQPDSAIPDENGVENREETLLTQIAAEDFSPDPLRVASAEPHSFSEDVLAANASLSPEESEREVLSKDSNLESVSEDDLDAKQKPVERRIPPPPPPPHRFPNQNK